MPSPTDLPSWAKWAMAAMLGFCQALLIAGIGYVGNSIQEQGERLSRIEATVDTASGDRYGSAEADAINDAVRAAIRHQREQLQDHEGRLRNLERP